MSWTLSHGRFNDSTIQRFHSFGSGSASSRPCVPTRATNLTGPAIATCSRAKEVSLDIPAKLRVHVAPAFGHPAENPQGNGGNDTNDGKRNPDLRVYMVRVPQHARGADRIEACHFLKFGHRFGALHAKHRFEYGHVAVPAAALAKRSFLRQIFQRQNGLLPVMAVDVTGEL